MTLKNRFGIDSGAQLARTEEQISKKKAVALLDTGEISRYPAGCFESLRHIHRYLFEDLYDFAGCVRQENIAKGNFRFAPVMYLEASLQALEQIPQSTFDEIVEKYVEMNVAHPFCEGNGRSAGLWLDQILKQELGQVADWNKVDKEEYLPAMERSPIRDTEIKLVLKQALIPDTDNRQVFVKGLDNSCWYEGYNLYRTADLVAQDS